MLQSEYSGADGGNGRDGGTALKWFSKHPLVSTVLWAFGAQQNAAQNGVQSKSSNRLSWLDEHGGQLNQYYGDGAVRTSVQNGVYSTLERKDSDERSTSVDGDDEQQQDPAMDDSMETVSPQWGWYVSITPPQEVYAKSPSSGKSH